MESTMKNSALHKFFIDQMRDIYWAEQHIVESLPKMESAATSRELKNAFSSHLEESKTHVRRLEDAFEDLDEKSEGKVCPALKGLVKEAEEIMAETEGDTMVRDAALILAAQKIEHYEIATYGGLITLANVMKHSTTASLLAKTIEEEKGADDKLTEIAESFVNQEAAEEH